MHFQEQLASMHQLSNLSANAIPFQLQAALPTPRLARVAGGLQERERDGATSDFSPPCRTTGSPLNRLSSPTCYLHLQTSDDGALTTDGSTAELASCKRGKGVEVVKAARVAGAIGVLLTLTDLLPPMEKERRKMDFLAKSIFQSLVVRKATPMM